MVDTQHLRPREMDLDRPCAARIYDAFLGGSHNFGVEREFVDRVEAALPGVTEVFRENRAFVRRTVEYLIQEGVTQFIDLGSGIPTIGPVHEVARRKTDDFHVLYVDNEPLTVAHSRPLLAGDARVEIIEADGRVPESILGAPETRRLIDFEQPVGLLLSAVLHFIPDADAPHSLVAAYRDALAPGSYLMVSHVTGAADPTTMRLLVDFYANTSDPLVARSTKWIDSLFDDMHVLAPGTGYLPDWRPEPGHDFERARYPILYGGLGKKPW